MPSSLKSIDDRDHVWFIPPNPMPQSKAKSSEDIAPLDNDALRSMFFLFLLLSRSDRDQRCVWDGLTTLSITQADMSWNAILLDKLLCFCSELSLLVFSSDCCHATNSNPVYRPYRFCLMFQNSPGFEIHHGDSKGHYRGKLSSCVKTCARADRSVIEHLLRHIITKRLFE